MKNKNIGIDLGTTTILIYEKNQGIVLCEPSVVAVDKLTQKVIAVGEKAYNMLGRTPNNIIAIKPLKDGVIADFDKTEVMLDYLIRKIKGKSLFSRPKILICCPSNITQVEKNAIREVAERTGAKKVFVEEEPKVAAVGAGMDIALAKGNMIVDIGGGTTDIAVLSLNGIVCSESLKIAGNTFDSDIMKYIKSKYKLLIGDITAENIKKQIGTVLDKVKEKTLSVKGRDLYTGLPKIIEVKSSEVSDALKESINLIIHSIKSVLEKVGPEISSDIIDRGIMLTGGGALLNGLDNYIGKELNIPVKLAKNPLTSVAEGTGIMLETII